MLWKIKLLVDKFVEEVKAEVEADIENRMRKEKEKQLSDQERWNAQLSRREAEVARQELLLRMEKEEFEKEKMEVLKGGTAIIQHNEDGALEITHNGDQYRCLRFAKANK